MVGQSKTTGGSKILIFVHFQTVRLSGRTTKGDVYSMEDFNFWRSKVVDVTSATTRIHGILISSIYAFHLFSFVLETHPILAFLQ